MKSKHILVFLLLTNTLASYIEPHRPIGHEHGKLEVVKISDLEQKPFSTLFQMYEYEFAANTGKEINEQGEYEKDEWSPYGVDVYLFYCGATPIGFAVVNLSSILTGDPDVRDIAEFFITPSHRRMHYLGSYFSHKIFDLYPTTWEVRQLPGLEYAYKFWQHAIGSYTNNQFESVILNDTTWHGTVQKFDNHSNHKQLLDDFLLAWIQTKTLKERI